MNPMRAFQCTYQRDGEICGRYEDDKAVHVADDERMRRGAHVWRHDSKQAHRLSDEPPVTIAEARARREVAAILDAAPPTRRAAILAGALAMLDVESES